MNRLPANFAPTSRRARGSVLLTTVILLLMITVLAIGALSLNSTQTRIATNSADAQIAFQTAEGALNQVQSSLLAGNIPDSNFINAVSGYYFEDPTVPALWKTVNWSGTAGVIQSFQGNSSAPAAYFIEQLPPGIRPGIGQNQKVGIYRITVHAVGPSGGAPVTLQAVVQVLQ
jgi:type IV pilus assembly protein PilX